MCGYWYVFVVSVFGMECEFYVVVFVVFFVVVVVGIEEVFDIFGVEWDKIKMVGDEFVSKNWVVVFNFD